MYILSMYEINIILSQLKLSLDIIFNEKNTQ